jgi:hypothetical protein
VDSSLLIALLAATVSLLLLGVTVVLVVALVVVLWRARRNEARLHAREVVTPVPYERDLTLLPKAARAPSAVTAPASRVAAVAATPPSPQKDGGLLGFFDDESSAPGLDANRAGLFAPSGGGVPWPAEDVSEEGEATEIFSSHSAAADLAEFAFDEADEATGRFPKTNESR